ncbi:MAG: hypothetical protein ABIH11_02435 [Candidatus Altiarchaeota archaeon]
MATMTIRPGVRTPGDLRVDGVPPEVSGHQPKLPAELARHGTDADAHATRVNRILGDYKEQERRGGGVPMVHLRYASSPCNIAEAHVAGAAVMRLVGKWEDAEKAMTDILGARESMDSGKPLLIPKGSAERDYLEEQLSHFYRDWARQLRTTGATPDQVAARTNQAVQAASRIGDTTRRTTALSEMLTVHGVAQMGQGQYATAESTLMAAESTYAARVALGGPADPLLCEGIQRNLAASRIGQGTTPKVQEGVRMLGAIHDSYGAAPPASRSEDVYVNLLYGQALLKQSGIVEGYPVPPADETITQGQAVINAKYGADRTRKAEHESFLKSREQLHDTGSAVLQERTDLQDFKVYVVKR